MWSAAPIASALLSCIPAAARADDTPAADSGGLAEVVVTAQKRTENIQDVPISIQAFGTEKLEQMNVSSFDDYAKMIPSLSFQSEAGPSFEHTYMRGVASGGDGNHSGSQPSVGMYMDEQPVTTIDGNLNLHIYDVQRIEALSGPQGTLYGASSESGTIRIITNKPDPKAFAAGYDVEGNSVTHGGDGYKFEGFVNIPLSDVAAVRLVGWDEKDAGYINNVAGTAYFGTSGITVNSLVKEHANDIETKGGRAALKFDLNDNWTILPQIMGQVTDTNGDFSYNPAVGDLENVKFQPEYTHDSWVQSALTVEGKIADFDLVYAGAYLTRNTHEAEDYTDYSLAYDATYGNAFLGNAGNLIDPAQYIIGRDHYTKLSNELRVSSPQSYWFRGTAGVFFERQSHYILQDYEVPGQGDPLATSLSVPGWPGTVWLTDQVRTDRDQAAFTELTEDLIWSHPNVLTLTEGIRYYTFDNTLGGYYGFGPNFVFGPYEGVDTCYPNTPVFHGAPCSDLNGRSTGSGNTPKISLNYKFDNNKLLYATWSKGYRPGGVNRNGGGTLPPYKPDYLSNYEIGWKTSWFDNSLRWNGAVFDEKWKDFQFAYLGANALTIIANAGNAEIRGVESDLEWAVTRAFTLSGSASYLDAKLTQTYCSPPAPPNPNTCLDPNPAAAGNEQYAPNGERLPVTPRFKGNITGRYNFPLFSNAGYLQGSVEYVGARTADLRELAAEELGPEPSYAIVDFAAGMQINKITAELYVSNAFNRLAVIDRYAECDADTCGPISVYTTPNQPRTIGLRFGQRF